MAAELFQSVGVEVTLFAISIVLAVTFRGATFGKQKAGCQIPVAVPFTKPSRAQSGATGAGRGKSPGAERTLAAAPWRQPTKRDPEAAQLMAPTNALTQKIESMINCANKRRDADAIAIYEVMRANGEHNAIKDVMMRRRKRPADLFALLVQSAGNVGRPELIKLFLDDMIAAGIDRSLNFYETAMKMLASKKCFKEALSVCSYLEADGLEPSPVTLSCLISFAAEIGESDRALSFFNRLAASSMPSIRAYMTILRVHSRRQDWGKSVALIRDMQTRQAPIDTLVLNIVLSTGVQAGQLHAAKALLKEFVEIADVVSYNTVMKGLAHEKDVARAITLLDEMCQAGVKPNTITFNTAIDAGIRSLQVADAWRVLARMLDAGLAPDKFTCTTLMKGLQNGATSEQLTVILGLLKNVTEECNASLCSSLFRGVIEATAQVNDPTLTARAVAQMREQRVMLSPQEHQRLLRVLMRDAK